MSEKQREALERIEAALPNIPEKKQEYLLGYADAMDDMNRKEAEGDPGADDAAH